MSSTKFNAVSATSMAAKVAAESVIIKGGALGAVVAGAFAAAASNESVLLGPVQVLCGGGGLGLYAWDGRVRQPGKGVQRPRGFTSEDDIPDAARIGASAFVAALVSALAHAGTLTLAGAIGPALSAFGKKEPRGAFLAEIKDRGTRAFLDQAEPLLAVAGRLAGGILTADDLDDIDARMKPAKAHYVGSAKLLRTPWEGPAEGTPARGVVHTITATDRAGAFAALAYEVHEEGVLVPELGLLAPFYAEPVVRGQTRTRPGHALPSPAPIALLSLGPNVDAALGARPGTNAEKALHEAAVAAEEGKLMSSDEIVGVVRSDRAAASLFEG
jgi:hypothetical protein